jgi:hypothetical protein
MGAYRGQVFATGRDACADAYARTIAAYPMALTRSLNRIAFGAVVVDHEASRRASDQTLSYVATIYTVRDGLITRIETVRAKEASSANHIAAAQLDAYNAQDLDGYLACFTPDAQIGDYHGPVTQKDATEIRARYADAFATYPKNHAALLNRIAVGPVAFDHERVVRGASGIAPFEALAIYSVSEGRITRAEFVK